MVANNTLTVTTPATNETPETTSKIDLKKLKFYEANGTVVDASTKFNPLMLSGTATNTSEANKMLFAGENVDLTHLTNLETLSAATFSQNKDIKTLKLPAKAVNWQIGTASGSGDGLTSNYSTAVLNAQNKLEGIEFSGFGVNGVNIEDLGDTTTDSNNDWDNQIKNNTQLWTTITTMMNSLGYDAELEKADSPKVGVQNAWVAPTEDSVTKFGWLQKDVSKEDLITNSDTATEQTDKKWWTNKADADSTTNNADTNLNVKKSDSQTVYFKHNGIIWTWTQTKINTSSNKLTITLTPDETTLPNVYKAKNGENYFITSFRNQKWTAPSASGRATDGKFGVPFKFNIAIQKANSN